LNIDRRYKQIGLDRLVRLNWLEKTAYLVLVGNDLVGLKAILQKELAGAFRSQNTNVRGSLDKTISILMKIWANVPKKLRSLNEDGL
jgi:hypothetical protein